MTAEEALVLCVERLRAHVQDMEQNDQHPEWWDGYSEAIRILEKLRKDVKDCTEGGDVHRHVDSEGTCLDCGEDLTK
jgi:hypothetical protein